MGLKSDPLIKCLILYVVAFNIVHISDSENKEIGNWRKFLSFPYQKMNITCIKLFTYGLKWNYIIDLL